MRTLVTLSATIALALPGSAGAQDRSIFSVLDTQGRSVAASMSADGALSEQDFLSENGRRVQVWSLAATPGAELQIDLRSADFDAYLYAVGPGLGEGLRDDDGGEGLNSRLCVALDDAGEYRVVASSLGGGTGAFTLQVSERPGATNGVCPEATNAGEITDIADLDTEGRVLRVGDQIDGMLDGADAVMFGSPTEAWAVEGRAGESFSVDLLSDVFDAYLMVEGPGLAEWLQNDDGAGGCNARVTFVFPQTATYRVVASTLDAAGGPFQLVASTEPPPESDDGCSLFLNQADDEPDASISADDMTASGVLEYESVTSGQLTGNEALFNGRYMQAWTLQGSAGDQISVELRSADFDSYLYFLGPGFPDPISDDDGAGNLHSRICVELPQDGTYRVLTGPLSGVDAGDRFTVSVRDAAASGTLCDDYVVSPIVAAARLATLPTEGRSIGTDEEREGSLAVTALRHPDNDRLIQPWSFQAPGGTSVWIDVVSEEFDPLLYAVGGTIAGELYNDDHAGTEGCQTRLELGPDVSGPITLLVGSFYQQAAGDFLIRTSTDPGPLETGGCVGAEAASSAGTTADPSSIVALSSGGDRTLEIGTEVSGTLGELDEALPSGEPAQSWSFVAQPGDDLVIELISADFDPVLYLDGPGLFAPLRDDDGMGLPNSRIEYTVAEGGRMRVVVSAFAQDGAGAFRLRVIRRAR